MVSHSSLPIGGYWYVCLLSSFGGKTTVHAQQNCHSLSAHLPASMLKILNIMESKTSLSLFLIPFPCLWHAQQNCHSLSAHLPASMLKILNIMESKTSLSLFLIPFPCLWHLYMLSLVIYIIIFLQFVHMVA